MKRSKLYAARADQLGRTCCSTISDSGEQAIGEEHGRLWSGTVFYCTGEMARVRGADPADILGRDFTPILASYLKKWEDDNVLRCCFAAMGMGMLGPADQRHPILGNCSTADLQVLNDRLQVTGAYDHNWEVFNASLRAGRTLLFGDETALILPHMAKLEKKYRISGYFDDSKESGDYNSYGLMTINYALRVAELLHAEDPVRAEIESLFRPHAQRYLELLRIFIGPDGMGWLFGRSAGVLGQLQCLVFMEQLLSKGWLVEADAAWARCASRKVLEFMDNVFWDTSAGWYNFRDTHRSCYGYRTTLPMTWDLWRYFLQMESYARLDEDTAGEELPALPSEPFCREVVTDPNRHTSYLIWSDGRIKWQMPVMGGPTWLAGDNLPRPYLPGLFEWCTSGTQPVLCPRLTVGEVQAWPAWWPSRSSRLEGGEGTWAYRVFYDKLVDGKGHMLDLPVADEVTYRFGNGFWEREDRLVVNEPLHIDEFRMEALQAARHPTATAWPPVFPIACHLNSTIPGLTMAQDSVAEDPAYRNYFSHPSLRWIISGAQLDLAAGEHTVSIRIEW